MSGDLTAQCHPLQSLSVDFQQFGRSGVPLYLLYTGKGAPLMLPQILTAASVLDALGHS